MESLDIREKRDYLKPEASPMDKAGIRVELKEFRSSPWGTGYANHTTSLDGIWEMQEGGETEPDWTNTVPAKVPGSVHLALWEAGIIEDPYYGKNDEAARAQSFKDWWFRKTFYVDEEITDHYMLKFGGICESAEVFLNGKMLGTHAGMFGGPDFDVSDTVKQGDNELIVHIFSAPNRKRRPGEMPTFFGGGMPELNLGWCDTAVFNCCYGWHYSNIPALGIWQSVILDKIPQVEMQNPFISAKDTDGNMEFYVKLASNSPIKGQLSGIIRPKNFEGAAKRFDFDVFSEENEQEIRLSFKIDDPRLWWPNGYGEQNLYTLELSFTTGSGTVTDSKSVQFGIRTIEMKPFGTDEEADEHISDIMYNWKFVINGRSIFMKGAGWCTMDVLMRFTRERYDRFLRRAKNQNLNIIRAWGGGLVETDEFYDLCDEYGICVMQEWPTAWDSYVYQPREILLETVERGTLRLRNRPSLIIWCGGNEGAAPLEGTGAYDPETLNLMGKMTYELDGTRPWHRQEGALGSVHDYTSSWGRANPAVMMTHESIFFGEFGLDCFPNMETIRSYTPENELSAWPIDPNSVVAHHTPMFNTNGDLERQLMHVGLFLPENSLENAVLGSQIAQSVAVRYTLERARTRFPESIGAIMYKLNDIYPAASWATIDSTGAPKFGYYMVQDAFAPVTAVAKLDGVRSEGEQLTVPVFVLDDNEALKGKNWTANIRVYGEKWKKVSEAAFSGSGSLPNGVIKAGELELTPAQTATAPLFIVTEVVTNGNILGRNWYFINYESKQGCIFDMPGTQLELTKTATSFTVTNVGRFPAIAVNFVCDKVSADFTPEDNFFWLEPGENRIIKADFTKNVDEVSCWNPIASAEKPTAPAKINVTVTSHNEIDLSWEKTDNTVRYDIIRNGEAIACIYRNEKPAFTDRTVTENTTYTYTVSAVNSAEVSSDPREIITVSTPYDSTKPEITKIKVEDETHFTLHFNKEIASDSLLADNFYIEGIKITNVEPADGNSALKCTCSPLGSNILYILTAKKLTDTALRPNTVSNYFIAFNMNIVFSWDPGEPRHFGNELSDAVLLDGADVQFGPAYTVSFAFRAEKDRVTDGKYIHLIFAKGPKREGHFELYISNDGTLRYYAPEYSPADLGSGMVVDDGKRHEASFIYENNSITFVVDGKRSETYNKITGSISKTAAKIAIGALHEEKQFPFYGEIEYIRISKK